MTVARELKQYDQRLGSLPLFLSLFLLLLAFFIFLNSISSFEARKSDQVIASIRASFPGFGEDGGGPGLLEGDRIGGIEQSVATRLNEAFSFSFPKLTLNVVDELERIYVDVPLERLFVPGASQARITLQVLSRRLAMVLADPALTSSLEVRIVFGHDGGGRLAKDRLTLERASIVIDGMIKAGSPRRNTSVGLEPGHLGFLRFGFRVMNGADGSRTGEE
ncbi:MAG: hypothetical protein OSB69_09990 [Alphaproteobacteria bacterium]|nr:hypothetical protein [Alphaproteobacteria bacterium]